jgi:hypothetical protein
MVVRGRVQNGVVVLAGDIRLEEGQEVTVLVRPFAEPAAHSIMDIAHVRLGAAAHQPCHAPSRKDPWRSCCGRAYPPYERKA